MKKENKTVSFIFVLSASFLLIFGTYISGTVLTPYAKDIGASWFEIGILSGSMYVIRLLFGTPIGKLADRKGTLQVLKYSLMLYPFIAVAYYFATNITILFAARLLHGIASAMMIPMGMAYVGHISPIGSEGKYMSIYNFCTIMASSLGAMLSTMIAEIHGYRSTFLLLFVLAAFSLLIIQFSKDDRTIQIKVEHARVTEEILIRKQMIYLDKEMIALVFANFALAVTASLIGFFILPQLENIGVKLKYTGSVVAIYYVISGIIQIPFGKYIDRHNKLKTAVVSGLIASAALLIFPLSQNIIMVYLCMGLTALGAGAFQTTISSISVLTGRKHGMGKTMGFLNTANSAGMIFGCLMLGLLPVNGGNYYLFFIFSSILSIILIFFFWLFWSLREKEQN